MEQAEHTDILRHTAGSTGPVSMLPCRVRACRPAKHDSMLAAYRQAVLLQAAMRGKGTLQLFGPSRTLASCGLVQNRAWHGQHHGACRHEAAHVG